MKYLIATFVFLMWIFPAIAQVQLDANAVSYTDILGVSSTTISNSTLTVGTKNNRALIAQFGSSVGSTTSCTWDAGGTNQAMSLIISKAYHTTERVELWGLVNPVSGNKTLTCIFTAASYVYLNATAFYNVDQTGSTTTFYNSASAGTNGAGPAAVTISNIAAGDIAIDTASTEQDFTSPAQTQLFLDHAWAAGASYKFSSGGNAAFSWPLTATGYWGDAATGIKAVSSISQSLLMGIGH